ncbi:MAG TPA: hypothetical protein VGJ00_05420 [Rhabdochlamydiaceae bacterium]|jgi:hypothetical protein
MRTTITLLFTSLFIAGQAKDNMSPFIALKGIFPEGGEEATMPSETGNTSSNNKKNKKGNTQTNPPKPEVDEEGDASLLKPKSEKEWFPGSNQ